MTPNIYVYIVDMPFTATEMVMPCPDGFTVYLNARLSYKDRVRGYLHALKHIENGDWQKSEVGDIEADAHK